MSRSHRSDGTTGESVGASAGFAALAIGVAAALVPLRDELGSANAALLLVMIVVAAAAVTGRVGGVVTGVVASLAFNFFYTKPYLTLRIHSGRDVVTTVLIVVLGLAVGELGVAEVAAECNPSLAPALDAFAGDHRCARQRGSVQR